MSTDTPETDDRDAPRPPAEPTDILLVGTRGGGGIHQYVDEQAARLPDHFSVSVHDMETPPDGGGLVWFVTAFLRSLLALLQFPVRPRPDVVHVHASHAFSFYRATPYVLFSSLVWRRPVIFHVHGSSFDEFAERDSVAVRWLQSAVFGRADRVVVLSEYWRGVLSKRVRPDKIQVLPNAVDPDGYDPGFGADPPHLVFVSNLVERKGVDELVAAIDTLAERDVTFRASIAGEGPLSDVVAGAAERHDAVEQLGFVSEAAKRSLLDSGAVFVLPTHAEGLPIAMLEGMAGGNAVVSTTVGSIPEVIGEGNGRLVEPGDPDALADALEERLADVEGTREMARRNRQLVESTYSWDRTTDRLERMYVTAWRKSSVSAAITRA